MFNNDITLIFPCVYVAGLKSVLVQRDKTISILSRMVSVSYFVVQVFFISLRGKELRYLFTFNETSEQFQVCVTEVKFCSNSPKDQQHYCRFNVTRTSTHTHSNQVTARAKHGNPSNFSTHPTYHFFPSRLTRVWSTKPMHLVTTHHFLMFSVPKGKQRNPQILSNLLQLSFYTEMTVPALELFMEAH